MATSPGDGEGGGTLLSVGSANACRASAFDRRNWTTSTSPLPPAADNMSPQKRIIAAVTAKDNVIERQLLVMSLASAVLGERKLEKALQSIVDGTCSIVNCERVSIFLIEKGVLVCKAAPASGGLGLRVPIGRGVVGHVAKTGCTLNIADAYKRKDLFDPSYDVQMGFVTTSILCMPLIGGNGEVIGVLQAINKTGNLLDTGHVPFDAMDERMLALLLALTSEQLRVTGIFAECIKTRTLADTTMELCKMLSSHRELADTVRAVALTTRTLANCQQVLIFLREPDGSLMVHATATHPTLQGRCRVACLGTRVEASDGSVVGRVARSGVASLLSGESSKEKKELVEIAQRFLSCGSSAGIDVVNGAPANNLASTAPEVDSVPSQSLAKVAATVVASVACLPLMDREESEEQVVDHKVLGVVLLCNKLAVRTLVEEADPNDLVSGTRKISEAFGSRISVRDSNADDVGPFQDEDVDTLNATLLLAAQLVKTAQLYDKEKRANRKLGALLTLIPKASSALDSRNVLEVVQLVSRHSLEMFECDRCTFFTVDHFTNALVGHYAHEGGEIQEFRVPIGVGIVGLAASTGELLNIKDAWGDERFSKATDLATGYRTESILCAPLRASNGKVIAVLQCINKRYHEHFGKEDESLLTTISILLSDMLQHALHKSSYGTFIQSSDEIDSEIKDMFRLYHPDPNGLDGSAGGSLTRKYTVNLVPHSPVDPTTASDGANLESWEFDHTSFYEANGPATQIRHVELMLERFGLVGKYRLPQETLASFLIQLRSKYSAQVVYHNWNHAVSTLRACFLLLVSRALFTVLPSADILGLLLAAPGHDAGHPGRTNAFQVLSQSNLALRYNDMSVLENHHAAMTCGLLRRSEPTNVLACADVAVTRRVRQVMVASILSTDMSKHSASIEWLDASNLDLAAHRADRGDSGSAGISLLESGSDQALQLGSALLHVADISHPVMPWAIHQRQCVQVAEEFLGQFEEEQALGMPTLPFMGKDPKDLKALSPVQVGFLQFVCAPLWSAVNLACGEDLLSFALENLEQNRRRWLRISDGEEVSDEQPYTQPPPAEDPY
eukprot:TRINITY_DN41753_c0_g1_i1.p1 TRINITY_DN41753_c0_g1~~TRINITY_DN41753_c0_g1_i1.p1  ORF type:complete len:1075 (-),score=217.70 TRINITY_DN41753_c0_g1_i1:24-3248(-)